METMWTQRVDGKSYTNRLVTRLKHWRSQLCSRILPKRVSAFSLFLLLWVGLLFMTSGAVALGRSAPPPNIRFVSYMAMLPGSHKSVLKTFHSTCAWGFDTDSHTPICKFSIPNDVFTSGEARIYNNIIQDIRLFAKENQLRVGDLVLLLGRPTHVYHFYGAINIIWYDHIQTLGVRVPHLHNWLTLPVSNVYFFKSMPLPSTDRDD